MIHPLVIAVTGGIGCGKSSVCKEFDKHAVPVIDADLLARDLVEPGLPALAEIAATFGDEMIAEDGRLRRDRLRSRVFNDPAALRLLEQIIHPRVRQMIEQAVSTAAKPYLIVCIPLLLETRAYEDLVERILVVDCKPETQIQRVMERDHLTRSEVEAIMRAQVSRAERLRAADDVIDNEGAPGRIVSQVKELHHTYLSLTTGPHTDL